LLGYPHSSDLRIKFISLLVAVSNIPTAPPYWVLRPGLIVFAGLATVSIGVDVSSAVLELMIILLESNNKVLLPPAKRVLKFNAPVDWNTEFCATNCTSACENSPLKNPILTLSPALYPLLTSNGLLSEPLTPNTESEPVIPWSPINSLEPVVANEPVSIVPPPPNDEVATACITPLELPTHA
jgi:hypothetical protein